MQGLIGGRVLLNNTENYGVYLAEALVSPTVDTSQYGNGITIRVSSRGGAGGEASPPNCPTSPPKEKEKEREKGERERERGRGRERERERGKWERGGGSIYLGIMIYVSNISLIITNIKLMYKNTLCNTSWGATVRESATPPSTPNKIFWMKP